MTAFKDDGIVVRTPSDAMTDSAITFNETLPALDAIDTRQGAAGAGDDKGSATISLADDTLDRAQPVGSSDDGRTSIDHDAILYRR